MSIIGSNPPARPGAGTAQAAAERLGADVVNLAWTGAKPASGLAAAARIARHRLIAEAAGVAGVRVLVFGHTADDRIEAVLMRDSGHRMGDLREWSPSPVWPEGRGLFILRPLLGLRRVAIREALAADGETWIDDPANTDARSPRARVRPKAAAAEPPDSAGDDNDLARLAAHADIGAGGDISIGRDALRSAARSSVRRLIGAAVACVGGGASTPRSERLEALTDRLLGPNTISATLSGAKIFADGDVHFTRNAGEASRGGLAHLRLCAGEVGVWDGRLRSRRARRPSLSRRWPARWPGWTRRSAGRSRPCRPRFGQDCRLSSSTMMAERPAPSSQAQALQETARSASNRSWLYGSWPPVE